MSEEKEAQELWEREAPGTWREDTGLPPLPVIRALVRDKRFTETVWQHALLVRHRHPEAARFPQDAPVQWAFKVNSKLPPPWEHLFPRSKALKTILRRIAPEPYRCYEWSRPEDALRLLSAAGLPEDFPVQEYNFVAQTTLGGSVPQKLDAESEQLFLRMYVAFVTYWNHELRLRTKPSTVIPGQQVRLYSGVPELPDVYSPMLWLEQHRVRIPWLHFHTDTSVVVIHVSLDPDHFHPEPLIHV